MKLEHDRVASPMGEIHLVAREGRLLALDFADCRERMMRQLSLRFGGVELVPGRDPFGFSTKLRDYLRGTLDALDAARVDTGGTEFQRQVWRALRRVSAGRTASYGEIARAVGRPKAMRAVGAANSRNPIALVIPCHRIVGANGQLTGYAGGLERKRWLLEHEQAAACLP